MTFVGDRKTNKVIDLNIDLISYDGALCKIIALAKNRTPSYVCFANVHMTIESHEDKNFAAQVNNASLVLSDGMPLVKYLNFYHGHLQDRIAGMDVFPDLIELAQANRLKVFFFGTTQVLLEAIKVKVSERFPKLEIVGLLSPPFDKSVDDDSYVDTIRKSEANLVFVALGCPKQEKWMATHSPKINGVLLGVGGAFPVFAGVAKRAPLLLQNIGLEWVYRLAQEPTRLFERYLKTNTKFLFLIIRERLRVFFYKD